MVEKRMPYMMFPPGVTISDELEAWGWTQKDLAEIMGRPEQAISEIINAKKQITPETAIELSSAFGTSAEFWMNLETNYQLWLSQKKKKEGRDISRKSRLYSLVPIPELKRKGWLRNTNDIDALEADVCSLLGIASPDETPKTVVHLRDSRGRGPEINALIVWVKRVEQLVQNQNPGRFTRSALQKAIPHILDLASDVKHLNHLPETLIGLGVRFVIVPHLKRTYLDGAAFRLNGNPVIALTLRYDRIDVFWFTLMHEIAHLTSGHKGNYFDVIYSDQEEGSPEEVEANQIAQDWLINPTEYKNFIRDTQPFFSKKAISEFAQDQKRHPGIVLGRLQYDKRVDFSKLRSMLVKISPILKDWYDKAGTF